MKLMILLSIVLFVGIVSAECDITAWVDEGATETYEVGGVDYEVKVVDIIPTTYTTVSGTENVVLKVDGEMVEKKTIGQTFEHRPGIVFKIHSISLEPDKATVSVDNGDQVAITESSTAIVSGGGADYSVEAFTIWGDTTATGDVKCKVQLNGEVSSELKTGQSKTFLDDSVIKIKDILDDESKPGLVEICLISGMIPVSSCESDTDCDDGIASTKDSCGGSPKKCTHVLITACTNGDGYCPEGCDHGSDDDCDDDSVPDDTIPESPEVPVPECVDCHEDLCAEDIDCDDDNKCTSDVCGGIPKTCQNIKTMSGCSTEKECVPIGTRSNIKYCGADEKIYNLLGIGEICNNDYECQTNMCIENVCIKKNIIKRFFSWMASWF